MNTTTPAPQVQTDITPEAQPWVGTRTPPAQYDVMHGHTYVPDAAPVLRAGSLDYKRLASRGYSC